MHPGEVLFNIGDPAASLFIVHTGKLVCLTGENKIIKTLVGGDIFGEMSALRLNNERSLLVKAREPTELYELEADDFEESFLDYPQVTLSCTASDSSNVNVSCAGLPGSPR